MHGICLKCQKVDDFYLDEPHIWVLNPEHINQSNPESYLYLYQEYNESIDRNKGEEFIRKYSKKI